MIELFGHEKLMNEPAVQAHIECLDVGAPMEHIGLTVESARPHAIEGPRAGRRIKAHSIDYEGTHCGGVLCTCQRLLPGEGELLKSESG